SAPDPSSFTGPYDAFLAKYRAKYGEPISTFHAHGYDAANILFDAIERAPMITPDGSLPIGRYVVRNQVSATWDHEGVMGLLTCDPYGDCSLPVIGIFQITADDIDGGWPPAPPVWRPDILFP